MARTYILALEVTDKDPVDGHAMETGTVLLEAKTKNESAARGIAASTALGLWPDSTIQIMASTRLKANGAPVSMDVAPYAQKAISLYICPDDPKAGGEIVIKDLESEATIGVTNLVGKPKAKSKTNAFALVTGGNKKTKRKKKKKKATSSGTTWSKAIGSPLDDDIMQQVSEQGTFIDYIGAK